MKEKIVYGPWPNKENIYHKLPEPSVWIDDNGFNKIKKSKILFLEKIRKEKVGTSFGVGQLHGDEMDIYTLLSRKKC